MMEVTRSAVNDAALIVDCCGHYEEAVHLMKNASLCSRSTTMEKSTMFQALIENLWFAGEAEGQDGVPLALLIAALAIPGFALKQFINCVQLRTAMQQLVATDRDKLTQSGKAAKAKLDALAKVQ